MRFLFVLFLFSCGDVDLAPSGVNYDIHCDEPAWICEEALCCLKRECMLCTDKEDCVRCRILASAEACQVSVDACGDR